MLADQWNQLGIDLTSAVTTFNQIVQMKVASEQWTGNSGAEMHNAATKLVTTKCRDFRAGICERCRDRGVGRVAG